MTAVLLFAKAPRAGQVKTRLAAAIGDARALTIYRGVGTRVAATIGGAYPLTVWYEPVDALEEMRAWLGEWEFQGQVDGDLGERMRHALALHLSRGDRPVIAIGADAPHVDAAVIARAVEFLHTTDVVLGPAVDGGYYLIGLNRLIPDVFRGIAWSTGSVLEQTIARCQRVGVRVGLLDELRDIDTVQDVQALGLDSP